MSEDLLPSIDRAATVGDIAGRLRDERGMVGAPNDRGGPPMARTDLHRLTEAAHRAVAHLDVSTDAVALYRSAAARAEQVWPGDLGTAVAGVLAIAAEEREHTQLRGLLGEHHTTIALALAVLARSLDQP